MRLIGSALLTLAVAAMLGWLDRRVARDVWNGSELIPAGRPLGDLGDPAQLGRVAMIALGQLWYGLVATFGLAAAGVAALSSVLTGRDRSIPRPVAASLLAIATSVWVTSVAAMVATFDRAETVPSGPFGGVRWDHHVYGRYIDAVALVLAVVGLVEIWRRSSSGRWPRSASWAAAGLVLGGGLLAARLSGVDAGRPVSLTVGAVVAITGRTNETSVLVAAAVASCVCLGLAAAAVRGRQTFLSLIVILLLAGSVSATAVASAASGAPRDQDLASFVAAAGPAAGANRTVVIAADATELPVLQLGHLKVQYQFVHEGWRTDLDRRPSQELAVDLGATCDGPAALLVRGDAADLGPQYRRVAEHGGAELWLLSSDRC